MGALAGATFYIAFSSFLVIALAKWGPPILIVRHGLKTTFVMLFFWPLTFPYLFYLVSQKGDQHVYYSCRQEDVELR